MKNLKNITIVLLVTLTFTFTASAAETYRKSYDKNDRKSYVTDQHSGTHKAARRVTNSTGKQYTHHNYSLKIQ